MSECSKCKGSRITHDAGLIIAEMITGGLVKANRPPRVYPCPKCCKELHEAVAAEYRKLDVEVERLQAELSDMTEEAFCNAAHCEQKGKYEGWWGTNATSSVKGLGDRLVELGLWERSQDGYGRMWWYRRKSTTEVAEIEGE